MPRDRYRALIDQLQYAGRRELIYGLHVHVAVGDPDRAIRIVNALRAHLCELVALSANSPFWRGEPTGFASCRHLIFSAFPRSGPPPHFRYYEEYADVIARARRRRLHRGLHADLVGRAAAPEVRHRRGARDGCRDRVEDAVALAAYVQALVRRYDADAAGAAACHPVLASENKWRAARYGLDGTVVDVAHGGPAPIRRRRAHAGRASRRTRASSAASASSKASTGSCATATAPPASSRRAAMRAPRRADRNLKGQTL